MTAETLLSAAILLFVIVSGLAVAVWVFDRLAPARFVQERHDFAVGAVILVPLLFLFSLRSQPAAPPAPIEANPSSLEPAVATASGPLTSVAAPAASQPLGEIGTLPWQEAALVAWIVVGFVLLVRLGLDLRAALKLKAKANAVVHHRPKSLSRPVEIKRSPDVTAPMLVGYFRPAILLPEGQTLETTPRSVLEHEVAHAVRGDVWIALAFQTIKAVFWWLLPLSLLSPIIRRTREMLCDTYAADLTDDPKGLAHALLDTALANHEARESALIVRAHGSDIPGRVRRLTTQQAWRRRKTWVTLTPLVPALVLTAFFATPRLGEAQAQESAPLSWSWINNDDDADLALYRAAYHGRIDEVRALIEAGEDPSAVSMGDGTPLMAAIRGRRAAVLDVLLDAGADPNRVAPGDGTALIAAARAGETSMAEKLVEFGADPDLGVDGDGNPLIVAAHRGEVSMIDLLLAAGADPNAAVPGDGNPLIGAALMGRRAAAERLLAAGADPDGYVYRDETPLIAAAQQGRLEMVNLLIAAGADVSLTVETPHHDPGGPYRSPLSEAERNGHDTVAQRLKEMGAEHRPPEQD